MPTGACTRSLTYEKQGIKEIIKEITISGCLIWAH